MLQTAILSDNNKIFAQIFALFIKSIYFCVPKQRGVEQLVARRAHNPKVVGSSPAAATINSFVNV